MKNKYRIKNKISIDDLKEMICLDQKVYSYEDAGVFDKCKMWYEKNSDIYTVIKHNNKIIGYINFMPLRQDFYESYKHGEVSDVDISEKNICKYEAKKEYNCLLTSIVIDSDYRGGEVVKILWQVFLSKLKKMEEKQIKIKKVLADCVSQDGEKFVKRLGLEFIVEGKNGKIYEGELKQ
jgi:hypothetical protein